jgi:hypothetical protein
MALFDRASRVKNRANPATVGVRISRMLPAVVPAAVACRVRGAAGTMNTRAAIIQARAPAAISAALMPAMAASPSRRDGAMALPRKPAKVWTENARPMRRSDTLSVRMA